MMESKSNFSIPPVSAKRTNLTCQHCIVGCGYHVYQWPLNSSGHPAPKGNALGIDLRKQAAPMSGAPAASMHAVIENQQGVAFNILIVPDKTCVVNRGLYSTRGGQLAQLAYNGASPTAARLCEPLALIGDRLFGVSWENAIDLYADIATRALISHGPDSLMFNCFDHGGGGGGFENTWGTGKLMFSAITTTRVRIHNRPAYNSECHASRDMGIGELNNSYEDAELADTLLVAGANPYETQTNYFLAHWLPNLHAETLEKKRRMGSGDIAEAAKIIIIDPRRTPTLAICESLFGANQVLHLDLSPGTDSVLFNALLTYIVDNKWHDSGFIDKHTLGFDQAMRKNRVSLEACSRITGLSVESIRKAAHWAYAPLSNGARRRTMHAYEKGIIWGNDNYRTQSALVNLALASRNVGRRGTGVVRLGGHQEGYVRPPFPGSRPAEHIDQAVIEGKGSMLTVWGTNPFLTTANAKAFKSAVRERTALVTQAINDTQNEDGVTQRDEIYRAIDDGGLFLTVIDLYRTQTANIAHLILPAAQPGEMNLTSMNGERRMRLSERFMDPPGVAKPDCLIAADIANRMKSYLKAAGDHEIAARFEGFDWSSEEDAFEDGFRRKEGVDNQGGATSYMVTYERLRLLANNGVQLPVKRILNGKLVGTEMLYADGKFDTQDGRARFLPSAWDGWLKEADELKQKYPFWVNNGRVNHIWQTAYHDQLLAFRSQRFPIPPVEISLDDAARLKISAGDIVELYNHIGSIMAVAYPEPDIKPNQVFVQFAHPEGPVGRLVPETVDRNVVPYYKGIWANLKKSEYQSWRVSASSFKSRRYRGA
jgi:arsenite oxidase large subunit